MDACLLALPPVQEELQLKHSMPPKGYVFAVAITTVVSVLVWTNTDSLTHVLLQGMCTAAIAVCPKLMLPHIMLSQQGLMPQAESGTAI